MYPKTFFTNNPIPTENGYCFVLMPFAQRFNKVFESVAESIEGPEINFTCQRADQIYGGGQIIEDMLRSMARAEIIIADLTTKNPNVFYELGIAHMVKNVEKVIILTQQMDDVPFDLRHLRCIVYEQNASGMKRLKRQLIDAILQITQNSYRFSVGRGENHMFEELLPGPDRFLYNFEVSQIMPGNKFAKFQMDVYKHGVNRPVKNVHNDTHGIKCDQSIQIPHIPWRLKLEKVSNGIAYFCVIPIGE